MKTTRLIPGLPGRDDAPGPAPRGSRGREIMIRRFFFAWVLSLVLAGCGSDPDFACDVVKTQGGVTSHGCTEIEELADAQLALAPDLCAQLGGNLVDACQSEGDLGTCTQTLGGLTQRIHFYSDGGVTAAIAKDACDKAEGTWTAN